MKLWNGPHPGHFLLDIPPVSTLLGVYGWTPELWRLYQSIGTFRNLLPTYPTSSCLLAHPSIMCLGLCDLDRIIGISVPQFPNLLS